MGGGTALEATTAAAGGFSLEVAPGSYLASFSLASFSGPGIAEPVATQVTVGQDNVKLDLVDGHDVLVNLAGTAPTEPPTQPPTEPPHDSGHGRGHGHHHHGGHADHGAGPVPDWAEAHGSGAFADGLQDHLAALVPTVHADTLLS